MRLSVLIDNTPNPDNSEFYSEHGLSFYGEQEGSKFLIDTGASDKFLFNAEKSGINVADIDFVVISHAHIDHTGGLEAFLQTNNKAKIYVSKHVTKDTTFYSTRRGSKRDISMNYSLTEKYADRFVFIDKNTSLTKEIALVCDIPTIYSQPKGNRTLLANDKSDDFSHEMVLTIDSPEGTIVFSSCCHKGILNTLKACSDKRSIKAFVGGTHLLDSSEDFQFETADEIKEIAETIQKNYPEMKLITGHCSGRNAVCIFEEILQSNFRLFHSGASIDL